MTRGALNRFLYNTDMYQNDDPEAFDLGISEEIFCTFGELFNAAELLYFG